jgi:hypothetical protein
VREPCYKKPRFPNELRAQKQENASAVLLTRKISRLVEQNSANAITAANLAGHLDDF